MSTTGCAAVRPNLGALVDGELRGATVLRVLRHVDTCRACAGEVEALRRLGDLVRVSASVDTPGALDGLASTIVSRSRAEAEQSWRGVLRRASEDWHWVVVGAG
jgi:anti-sigma factor RsiW